MSATERAAGKLWASGICQASATRLQEQGGIDEVIEYLSRDLATYTTDYAAGVQELINSIRSAKQ